MVFRFNSIKKKLWPLLKTDILEVFNDFFRKSIINKNVNNTYIALIAKKEKCLKAGLQTHLATFFYKILAKTISTRLKNTLPSTNSEN